MSGFTGQLDTRRAQLAKLLFDLDVIRFGTAGSRQGLHETDPTALPPPPYSFDLRTKDNPEQGIYFLTDKAVELAVDLMRSLIYERILYTHIGGLPCTGVSFVNAWEKKYAPLLFNFKKKVQEDGTQKIVAKEGTKPYLASRVLLVDDLMSAADSKFEGRDAVVALGGTVTDVVVLIDCEQGGREALAKQGITLHAVFTATSFFDFCFRTGLIDPAMYDRATTHLANEKVRAGA